jgi:hypothetical protein
MTHQEINQLVWDTPVGEWLVNEDDGIYTCTRDLNVRLVVEKDCLDPSHEFNEKWVTTLPDQKAYKRSVDLYFGASLVKKYFFVLIDGCRASIPFPKHGTPMTISAFEAQIGQIINQPNSHFDEYIERLRIQINPAG